MSRISNTLTFQKNNSTSVCIHTCVYRQILGNPKNYVKRCMTHKSTTCASTKELCDIQNEENKREKNTHRLCVKRSRMYFTHFLLLFSTRTRRNGKEKVAGGGGGIPRNTKEFPSHMLISFQVINIFCFVFKCATCVYT